MTVFLGLEHVLDAMPAAKEPSYMTGAFREARPVTILATELRPDFGRFQALFIAGRQPKS